MQQGQLNIYSQPYICFAKYNDFKFDIVIQDSGQHKTFADIGPKIAQIVKLTMLIDLDFKDLLFELFDPVSERWSIITAGSVVIKHMSVILVTKRFAHRTQRSLITSGADIEFLDQSLEPIIAFYLMVQLIDRHLSLHNLVSDPTQKWNCVYDIAVKNCPNIFRHYSSEMCFKLFQDMSLFYVDAYFKINMRLIPYLQKRFDMIKILHILDPLKVFDDSMRTNMLNMIKIISDMPDVKDYIVYQHKYQFDIYLNIGRIHNQWISYKEFQDNYIDYESKIIIRTDAPVVTPTTNESIELVTIE